MNPIANENRISFDRFALDLTNECLWRGSDALKIRPKAFALLNYLIQRPGQLVTKDELLNAVWPETFVGDAVLKVGNEPSSLHLVRISEEQEVVG